MELLEVFQAKFLYVHVASFFLEYLPSRIFDFHFLFLNTCTATFVQKRSHTCTRVERSMFVTFTNATASCCMPANIQSSLQCLHAHYMKRSAQFRRPLPHKSVVCVLNSRLHFIVTQNVCGAELLFFCLVCRLLEKQHHSPI